MKSKLANHYKQGRQTGGGGVSTTPEIWPSLARLIIRLISRTLNLVGYNIMYIYKHSSTYKLTITNTISSLSIFIHC